MRSGRIIMIALAGCCLFYVSCQSAPAVPENPAPAASGLNPDAAFPDYASKVLVVEIAAIGCPMSLSFCTELEKMHPALLKQGADALKIDVSPSADAVSQFYAVHPVSFKHIQDAAGEHKKKLDVFLIPTIVVIDKFGYIRFRGSLVPDELLKLAAKLSAETAPVPDAALKPAFKQGDAAPDFTAETIDGETFKLLDEVKSAGRVALFFNSLTCPFSMAALPQFEELSRSPAYASSVEFVVVNFENNPDELKTRADEWGFNCKYIADSAGILNSWRIEGAPFAAVVSADGKIEQYEFFNSKSLVKTLSAAVTTEFLANLKPLFPIFARDGENKFDFQEFAKPYKMVLLSLQKAEDPLAQDGADELAEFAASLGNSGGIGVLVIDVSEDPAAAAEYYKEKEYSFKVIYDPSGATLDSAGVMNPPHYFLVTPAGKIVDSGIMNPDRLNHYIAIMVEGKPFEPYTEPSPTAG